jgi:hypothetical protein
MPLDTVAPRAGAAQRERSAWNVISPHVSCLHTVAEWIIEWIIEVLDRKAECVSSPCVGRDEKQDECHERGAPTDSDAGRMRVQTI